MALALWYLERRARTEQELRQKLADKKVPPQEIEAVLAKLKEHGYVDDAKYAINFQRFRDDFRPTGKYRLKQELKVKGVPKEIIEAVETSKEKEFDLALAAAQTRLRQYSNLTPEVWYRRMSGFLARRGFDYGTIKQVLEQLAKGENGL